MEGRAVINPMRHDTVHSHFPSYPHPSLSPLCLPPHCSLSPLSPCSPSMSPPPPNCPHPLTLSHQLISSLDLHSKPPLNDPPISHLQNSQWITSIMLPHSPFTDICCHRDVLRFVCYSVQQVASSQLNIGVHSMVDHSYPPHNFSVMQPLVHYLYYPNGCKYSFIHKQKNMIASEFSSSHLGWCITINIISGLNIVPSVF